MLENKNPFEEKMNSLLGKFINSEDKKPLGEGQLSADSNKLEKARGYIDFIAQNSQNSPYFKHVGLKDFINDLKDRLQHPDYLNQSHLNVCGAATFCRFWIKADPENFVHTAHTLYQSGTAKYQNTTLTANTDMYEQTTSLNKIDWLMTASLQNAAGWLGYNPEKELGGVRGIALPGQVGKWLADLPNMSLEHKSTCPDTHTLNLAFSHNGAVAFLVNVNLLDNYFTDTTYRNTDDSFKNRMATFFNGITGNHYVALNSLITWQGDQIRFEVWTWGTSLEVVMPIAQLSECITQVYMLRPN